MTARRHSLQSQADALDALLSGDAVGAMYRGRSNRAERWSEADLLRSQLTAARDTLRFLGPISEDLRRWLEQGRRGSI